MYLLCLYGTGRNDIIAGKSISRPLEGVALKNETFLGPEIATSEANAIWAQKSPDRDQVNFVPVTTSPPPPTGKKLIYLVLVTRGHCTEHEINSDMKSA
jgi:hypothetical protein